MLFHVSEEFGIDRLPSIQRSLDRLLVHRPRVSGMAFR